MNRETLEKFGLRPQLPQFFDHSCSGLYSECERMWYYQYALGRRNVRVDRVALDWGSIVHKLADVWESTHNLETVKEVVEAVPDSFNADDRYGRNKGRMYEMLSEWIGFRVVNPMEILRTEQPTLVTCVSECPYSLGGCQLTYGGRMDSIVGWQGLLGPLDIKTTVMDDTDPVADYKLSHQMMGYNWIASHLMQKHCWGVIVERIITNKSKIKIGRFPVSYNKSMIREWAADERIRQNRIVSQFEVSSHQESVWLQNRARCNNPYPCHWRDVCLSPNDNDFRARWLRDNTTESRWDFTKVEQETTND